MNFPYCHRYSHIILVLILSMCCAAVPPSAQEASSPFEYLRTTIIGTGTPGPYDLEQPFIGGTISVTTTDSTDSHPLTIEEHPSSGTVMFDRVIPLGDTLTVSAAMLPSWIEHEYRRAETPRSLSMVGGVAAPEAAPAVPRSTPGLRFGGSKTFDVNVGSGSESALNQTLRLNISGNLTDTITLNAAISDQNVPISPEGNTRELEELDRVLIELNGPRFSAVMGDTDLSHTGGRWLSYERRLSGAQLEVDAGPLSVYGTGAISEGRHMSITLTPAEGNQGPYRLMASSGRRDIAIIPGTETVWINGEQLTRGDSGDYTIDYTTGELFFTERRIIGADMRIICDYEYTSESYLRNFYAAGSSGAFLDGRLRIDVTAAREADNVNKPVRYDLDTDIRQALRESGDSPALLNGIRPAEDDTSGTYDMVDGHLVFNPAGGGEYTARFSWVGENAGSYRYRGGGIYEYVAPDDRIPGAGASYEPVYIVDGPSQHDLAGVSIGFNPIETLTLEGEFAASALDLNTLSDIDDGDNGGSAGRFGFSYAPEVTLGLPFRATLAASHRTQEQRFTPLDRDRTAEENRGWGLPTITAPQKETVTEYTGGISVADGVFKGSGLTLTGGSATFGESGSSRLGGIGQLNLGDHTDAMINLRTITRDTFAGIPGEAIDRLSADMSTNVAGFQPRFRFEGERTEQTGGGTFGASYADYRTTVSTPQALGMTAELEWFYRDERTKQGAWADSAFVRGGSIGIVSQERQGRSFHTRYARRERITETSASASDQAVFDLVLRPEDSIYRFEATYRAGRSQEATKRRNYIYIGTGRGQYRWEDLNGDDVKDPDEFIPDIHGAYYLYEETLDDYLPSNTVSTFGTLALDVPEGILARFTGYDGSIRSETSFDINEKSTAPAADVFLLKLNRFRTGGATISGTMRLQEDITVPFGDRGQARLRWFRSDSYNAEYVTGAERRRQDERSIRLRLPAGDRYDLELTATRAFWDRTMEQRSFHDYRISSWAGDSALSYYPSGRSQVGLALGGGSDHDALSGLTAVYWRAEPSATYRFAGNGRLELSYMFTQVGLDGGDAGARLPYPMARGQKEGSNHDISIICDYRLSQRMNLIATYTGRKFGGGEFEHFARTQLRALF